MPYKTRFILSVIFIVIYELFIVFNPTGFTLSKIGITILMWSSFFILLLNYFKTFRYSTNEIGRFSSIVFLTLLIWNIFGIVRSLLIGEGTMTTLLGNRFTSFALLIPFALLYGIHFNNVKTLFRLSIVLSVIGILLLPIFINSSNIGFTRMLVVLFSSSMFFIPALIFYRTKDLILLVISMLFLFYPSYLLSNRTMMLRIVLLFFTAYILLIYRKYNLKLIPYFSFVLLIIPFYLFYSSVSSGNSVIYEYLNRVEAEEMQADTRTFLYTEVLTDLNKTDDLIFGRGASGKYYSDYFSISKSDSDNRLTVEVGVLSIILKVGLVGLLLYLLLFILCVYLAFFRSNNLFVFGVGMFIMEHIVLLFIENIISYSVYNYCIWFFTGLCLSKRFRLLNNREIVELLWKK